MSSRSSDAGVRERAHAAASAVAQVREVHNLFLVEVDGRTELSLHVKLPGDLPLDEAHEIAEQIETRDLRRRPGDLRCADAPRAAQRNE